MMITAVQPYIHLIRFHKPIGTFLLLWPTLIALWLASAGQPESRTVIIFALGVIVMRAAGCVINDYADRDFDKHVVRTKYRPITSGQIAPKVALMVFAVLMLCALSLALQLKFYTLMLAGVAAFLAIIYPFAKRFTAYPQFILGLAFAWSIPMVYAEVQGAVNLEAWLLFAATLAWVVAYDTQYAMADKADDLRLGIKSTALAFGSYDKVIILALQLLSVGLFLLIGMQRLLAWPFFTALAVCLGLVAYQQWLIKDRDPSKCLAAFLNNNYFGALVFLGLLG